MITLLIVQIAHFAKMRHVNNEMDKWGLVKNASVWVR